MNPQTIVGVDGENRTVLAPMIVSEVTKNWVSGEKPTTPVLCELFEDIIRHNNARGYRLIDWKMTTTFAAQGSTGGHYPGNGPNRGAFLPDPARMTETIVAVFEKV